MKILKTITQEKIKDLRSDISEFKLELKSCKELKDCHGIAKWKEEINRSKKQITFQKSLKN